MRTLVIGIATLMLLGCEDDFKTDRSARTATTTPDEVNAAAPAAPAPAAEAEGAVSLVPPATPVSATGDGSAFESLPRELARVLCDKIFECCGPSEAMSLVLGPQLTRENCADLAPFHFGDYFRSYTLSVVEQRVSYFADRVAACVDRLGARSCSEFAAAVASGSPDYSPYPPNSSRPLPPATFTCEDLFAPDQAAGQLCQNDYECVGGYCVTTLGTDRRCQSFVQEGGSCRRFQYDVRCAAGLYCGGEVCRKPGAAGERCYSSYTASTPACEEGLYCSLYTSPFSSTCLEKLSEGSLCETSEQCLGGQCDYSGPTFDRTCAPPPPPASIPPLACTGR